MSPNKAQSILKSMKILNILLITTALNLLPSAVKAQYENPRGIYKMATFIGKTGEIRAPYEQYKICTDSITITVIEQNNLFRIAHNDNNVFNYTGSQPKSKNDKSSLIYESSKYQFLLKWWSNFTGHQYFPDKDWCIEKYEAGICSDKANLFFASINGTAEKAENNPLSDTWRIIGYIDDLRDIKKELPVIQKNYPKSKYYNSFMVFGAKNLITVFNKIGGIKTIEYDGKNAYKNGDTVYPIKWLTKDRIAIEEHIDYRTDWMILERIKDGTTPLSNIASDFISKKR